MASFLPFPTGGNLFTRWEKRGKNAFRGLERLLFLHFSAGDAVAPSAALYGTEYMDVPDGLFRTEGLRREGESPACLVFRKVRKLSVEKVQRS